MSIPYPTLSGINELLNRQEFLKALQQLEAQFPNNNALQNLRGEANRIKNGRIMGTMTSQEIAAEENKLSARIREWMETVEEVDLKKVMIFFNNSPNSLDIKLSQESGEIERVFENAENTRYRLYRFNHLNYEDIIDQIIRETPYFVQFSMHADGEKGLKMIDENGNKRFINKERFRSDMVQVTKNRFLHGIMLNGCNTLPVAEQAKGIVPRIIATSEEIGDKAARIFSSNFYHSLLYHPNSTIDSSYEIAVKKLKDSPDEDIRKNADILTII